MEKKINFIISALYYALFGAIIYFVLNYALAIVAPFVVGFGVAAILNPFVRKLSCKFHMKRRPAALFVLLIFYGAIGTLLGIIVVRSVVGMGEFSRRLPILYANKLEPMIATAFDGIRELISAFSGYSDNISDDIVVLLDYIKSSLATAVSNFSMRAIGGISSFAAAIPKFMAEMLFAIISSFFFILDFERLTSTIKSRLSKKAVGILIGFKRHFSGTVVKYLRSYTIIMLITFSELFFGLSLMGIRNAFPAAAIIALLDMLPVIGTGAILLPWAIIEIIGQNLVTGIGLVILWAVILIIRNIIEPKIVSGQVGLNPIVTLISMFVGAKLFGFLGLFLTPIFLSVVLSLYREKVGHGEIK